MKVTTTGRYLVAVLLLYLGPSCLSQEITVRVINASNGRPLQKVAVAVGFLYDNAYDKKIPAKYPRRLSLETDANGEAHFRLPDPPPAHFGAHGACGLVTLEMRLLDNGLHRRSGPQRNGFARDSKRL